jgi:hypothetical protein
MSIVQVFIAGKGGRWIMEKIRVIKSRRMRWAGHVARKGRGEVFTGFWLGGPKARDYWEDLGVGGRITLRWTLGR